MQFKRRTVLDTYGKEQRLPQLYVLPGYKVAYMPSPKAGCSSIKMMLEQIYRKDHDLVIRNIHGHRTVPRPYQVGWARMKKMMRNDALYGFSVVRHPVKRFVSAYFNKMYRAEYRVEINKLLGRVPDDGWVTFDEFLTAIEMQDPQTMDQHWRPQHLVLMMDVMSYDFIGKLENISADMDRIREEAGLPNVPLLHRNKISRGAGYEITAQQRQRIETLYAKDFEVFGY